MNPAAFRAWVDSTHFWVRSLAARELSLPSFLEAELEAARLAESLLSDDLDEPTVEQTEEVPAPPAQVLRLETPAPEPEPVPVPAPASEAVSEPEVELDPEPELAWVEEPAAASAGPTAEDAFDRLDLAGGEPPPTMAVEVDLGSDLDATNLEDEPTAELASPDDFDEEQTTTGFASDEAVGELELDLGEVTLDDPVSDQALVDWDAGGLVSFSAPEPKVTGGVLRYDDQGRVLEEPPDEREVLDPGPDSDLGRYLSYGAPDLLPREEPEPSYLVGAAETDGPLFPEGVSKETPVPVGRRAVSEEDELDASLFDDDDGATGTVSRPVTDAVERFDLLEPEPPTPGAFDDEEATLVTDLAELSRPPVAEERPRPVAASVTAGLYGGSQVPTIRDGGDGRPKAAAIQINAATGTGRVLGREEEDEPIEIGDLGDYGEAEEEEEDFDSAGGFRVAFQQAEEEEEELEEEEEEADPPTPPPPVAAAAAPVPVRPAGPSPEVLDLRRRAKEAADRGDLAVAADLFSDVLDLHPSDGEALVGRGRSHLDLGDYTRAMSDFLVAEEGRPNDPEPKIALGDLYFARKDYRRAIDYFNAALVTSPSHAMAFCRRGISHYYRKNYTEALDDLLRARQIDLDLPNIDTYISMARKRTGR